MNRSIYAAGTAALITVSTAAQPFELSLQGRVIQVADPSAVFAGVEVGQIVEGLIGLNLGVGSGNPGTSAGGIEISLFDAVSFDVDLSTTDLTAGTTPQLIVLDDINSASGIGDRIAVFANIADVQANTQATMRAEFTAGPDLFVGSTPDQLSVLDLAQVDSAEITIEFNVPNGDGTVTANMVLIEILSLNTGANRIANLVCTADANENGEIDFGDFNAWVGLYNASDFRADINLDGNVNPADFSAWILAFNTGC